MRALLSSVGMYWRRRWIRDEHFQPRVDDFTDARNEDDLELIAYVLWNLFCFTFIARRRDYPPNTGTIGREHFLLDSPDRKHQSRQGNFSGHRRVRPHASAR